MAEFEDKLNALLSNPDSMAQVLQMAQALSGSMTNSSETAPASQSPAPASETAPSFSGITQPAPTNHPHTNSTSTLSGLLNGMDPGTIARLLPLIQELGSGQNSQAVALLHALRPFLRTERQEQVERAIQLAKMIHIAKKFFTGWEV